MAMSIQEKFVAGVLALLLGFVLFAATAVEKAGATDFQPVNQQVKLTNSTPTDFIPTNAHSAVGLRCTTSTAYFTVSNTDNRDENKVGVGAFSLGSGSIITNMDANSDITGNPQAPAFQNCAVWNFSTGTPVIGATTVTNTTNGIWTVAADAMPDGTVDAMLSIGVPKAGAVITFDAPAQCAITVSPDQASSVMAKWFNSEGQNGTAHVDGQLDISHAGASCAGSTPAQFEGSYQPDVAVTIVP